MLILRRLNINLTYYCMIVKNLKEVGFIPLCVGIYFSIYAILPGIVDKETASLVKTVFLAFIIIIMVFNYDRKNDYNDYMRVIIPFFVIYLIINIICHPGPDIIRWGINVTAFCVFYKYSNYKCFNVLSFALKIATLICTFSFLYYSIIYGTMAYFRDDALIDKAYLTAFYAMTYFFCIVDILYNRYKWFNVVTLIVFVWVNVFIVQSKTSLLALAIELITLYVFFPSIRTTYNKYLRYIVVIGGVAMMFLTTITLPQELTFGINRVLGFEFLDQSGFTRSEEHLSITFDVREDVRAYCFKLFSENPIFGIGQGQFKYVNHASHNYFSYLTQTESSWLQILTEGGLFYLFIMLYFFLKPIIDVRKKIFSNQEHGYIYYYLMAYSFFLVFAVMYLFNDFADSLFWLSAGIMASLISCDKSNVPPVF